MARKQPQPTSSGFLAVSLQCQLYILRRYQHRFVDMHMMLQALVSEHGGQTWGGCPGSVRRQRFTLLGYLVNGDSGAACATAIALVR